MLKPFNRAHLPARQVFSDHEKNIMWLRQGKVCFLTGRPIQYWDKDVHVAHLYAHSLGGSNHGGNVRLICREANYFQGTKSVPVLLALCKEIVENTPPAARKVRWPVTMTDEKRKLAREIYEYKCRRNEACQR